MAENNLSGIPSKDKRQIGSIFDLFVPEGMDPEIGENLRGKLVDIDREGYYCFKITSRNVEVDEYWTKCPLEDLR